MSHPRQIDAFVGDLRKVIARFAAEYDLPLASVVGCLELVKIELINSQTS